MSEVSLYSRDEWCGTNPLTSDGSVNFVERIWHIQDSQSQVVALASQVKVPRILGCGKTPLTFDGSVNFGCGVQDKLQKALRRANLADGASVRV